MGVAERLHRDGWEPFDYLLEARALKNLVEKQLNMEKQSDSEKRMGICPHCRLEVDPKASKCPHCQGKIYQWTGARKFIAGTILFFIIMAVIGTIADSGSKPESSTVQTQSPAQALVVGQSAYLRLPGNSDKTQAICLAPNLAVYNEYSAALSTQNYQAILGLADKGLFCVHNGSTVKVLETNSVYTKVKVIKGVAEVDSDKVGESGWSVTEWVSSN